MFRSFTKLITTTAMACANPGGGDDPNDPYDPPKTPRMVLKDSDSGEELTPDTEQNVAEETDSVFRNFVVNMLNNERDQHAADDTPSLPELTAFTDNPLA